VKIQTILFITIIIFILLKLSGRPLFSIAEYDVPIGWTNYYDIDQASGASPFFPGLFTESSTSSIDFGSEWYYATSNINSGTATLQTTQSLKDKHFKTKFRCAQNSDYGDDSSECKVIIDNEVIWQKNRARGTKTIMDTVTLEMLFSPTNLTQRIIQINGVTTKTIDVSTIQGQLLFYGFTRENTYGKTEIGPYYLWYTECEIGSNEAFIAEDIIGNFEIQNLRYSVARFCASTPALSFDQITRRIIVDETKQIYQDLLLGNTINTQYDYTRIFYITPFVIGMQQCGIGYAWNPSSRLCIQTTTNNLVPEVCGDDIDNDGDGSLNEGCGTTSTTPTTTQAGATTPTTLSTTTTTLSGPTVGGNGSGNISTTPTTIITDQAKPTISIPTLSIGSQTKIWIYILFAIIIYLLIAKPKIFKHR